MREILDSNEEIGHADFCVHLAVLFGCKVGFA